MPQREKGIVKHFIGDRGFGFISRTSGDDLFFHVSELDAEATAAPGTPVHFLRAPGRKGREVAQDVRLAPEDAEQRLAWLRSEPPRSGALRADWERLSEAIDTLEAVAAEHGEDADETVAAREEVLSLPFGSNGLVSLIVQRALGRPDASVVPESGPPHLEDHDAAPPADPFGDATTVSLLLRGGRPAGVRISGSELEELRQAARDLARLVSWHGTKHDEVGRARSVLLSLSSASDGLAKTCVDIGQRQRSDFAKLDVLEKKHGPSHELVLEQAEQLRSRYPHLARAVDKQLDWHHARVGLAAEIAARKKERRPLTTLEAGSLDHRVQTLSPAVSWDLLIDETGDGFIFDAFGRREREGRLGRFAGVLVPDGAKLPKPKRGAHFTEMGVAARDKVLQDLLAEPVGIFGITAEDLPGVPGDRWVDGVAHLVAWVLRLVPVENPTELRIHVEHRGEHEARKSDWDAVLRGILREAAVAAPGRLTKVNATIDLVEKDGHPLLAYADAVAHTWGSTSEDTKARRKASGLVGACLHNAGGRKLLAAWDLLAKGSRLEGAEWRELLTQPEAAAEGSIPWTLLRQLALACCEDVALWRRYFAATHDHLESKSIHLSALGREVEWLASCKPKDQEIKPAFELAWRTAELERHNHVGDVRAGIEARLEELGELLFEEVPTLVCQADLVRAVQATNRLDFDAATQVLHRWLDLPPVVAGRQHWARVQSSLGQHAAFRGRLDEAEACFARAIEAFESLSDTDLGAMEISQTATYRAIVAMDDPNVPLDRARELVQVVAPLDPDSISTLARSDHDSHKYTHHLLLRHLVARGESEERQIYLDARSEWSCGEGHPWPLIQTWRAVLLHPSDPGEAVELMRHGFELATAADQGPTVRFIGLTLGAVVSAWSGDPTVTAADLDALEDELPAAHERLSVLRSAIETPLDPPESVIVEVLPFNFR
jgi:cold shock CspA family protein